MYKIRVSKIYSSLEQLPLDLCHISWALCTYAAFYAELLFIIFSYPKKKNEISVDPSNDSFRFILSNSTKITLCKLRSSEDSNG